MLSRWRTSQWCPDCHLAATLQIRRKPAEHFVSECFNHPHFRKSDLSPLLINALKNVSNVDQNMKSMLNEKILCIRNADRCWQGCSCCGIMICSSNLVNLSWLFVTVFWLSQYIFLYFYDRIKVDHTLWDSQNLVLWYLIIDIISIMIYWYNNILIY